MQKIKFYVTGMTCASCSAHVENAVRKLAGVSSVGVNLTLGTMLVSFDESSLSADEICTAVQQEGYGCFLENKNNQVSLEEQHMRKRLLISVLFFIPLLYVSMGSMFSLPGTGYLDARVLLKTALELILVGVIIYENYSYYSVGFSRLFRLSPNMDSLVALGSSAGLIYSLIEIILYLTGAPSLTVYFESSGMILTLVTIGKYLEERSKKKTTFAISSLLSLAPDHALVLRDNCEVSIPSRDVTAGDIVVLKRGSKVPVDGILLDGQLSIDESAITGESIPCDKIPGSKIVCGTAIASGYGTMEATKVGEDTTIAQIVRIMEEAASSKAPISRFADRVAAVFVPVVMGIALLSFLLWYCFSSQDFLFCLTKAISVLVISCPCALGLATPLAIMVGTGKAAEHGILIKSAASLECLGKIDTIVLDKTGTVTKGQMQVQNVITFGDTTREELLMLLGSLEKPSEHPLSQAVLAYVDSLNIPLATIEQYESHYGGVSGALQGAALLAGNAALLDSSGISVENVPSLKGTTPVYVAKDLQLIGVLYLSDTLKDDSRDAIQAFRELGIEPVLLTGDTKETAEAVGKEVGITAIYAGVLPQEKAEVVSRLCRDGHTVAMVGDGINDAPALLSSNVGIAIGAGTDIAIESADIVLVRSQLSDIVSSIKLSRSVIKNIKGNLFWAFFYNVLGIPIAAGALYPAFGISLSPMIGAAAMSLSSIFVCTNALRLRNFSFTKHNEPVNPQEINLKENRTMTKVMTIEGMMCEHCKARVEKALQDVGCQVTIDLEKKTAAVSGDVSNDVLTKAVTDAGYTVVSID